MKQNDHKACIAHTVEYKSRYPVNPRFSNMHLLLFGALFVHVTVLAVVGQYPSCLDGNGHPVDWFIAIKTPDYIDANPQNGQNYFFMTSTTQAWELSGCKVVEECGPIYDTLSQAYQLIRSNTSVVIGYNDEKPEYSDDLLRSYARLDITGHMKGVLAFNVDRSGFWMIHSVPKFPGAKDYYYPDTGIRYGQHFFCVSYQYSQLQAIANQLIIARPTIFTYNLPDWVGDSMPVLRNLVDHTYPRPSSTGCPNCRNCINCTVDLTSTGHEKFRHFSKSYKFGADLYDSLVAPNLLTGLFMEGWINGRYDLNSSCVGKFRVYNIKKMQLQGNIWTTTHDHSKWAVSNTADRPWICLGDINRQASQFHRGGGTLCFVNPTVWKTFRSMVLEYEDCDN